MDGVKVVVKPSPIVESLWPIIWKSRSEIVDVGCTDKYILAARLFSLKKKNKIMELEELTSS